MATVYGIKESSPTGGDSLEKKKNLWTRKTNFGLVYQVRAGTSETMDDVLAAPGIPPLFYPYGLAYCASRDAKELNTLTINGVHYAYWEVDVKFDSKIDPSQENSDAPESKRPSVTWSGENVQEVFLKAYDEATREVPVQTTAGEPIFFEDDAQIIILNVTRYERAPFDPTIALQFANTINISPFYGAPRGSAKLMPIEVPDEEVINGIRYVRPTYQVKFKIRQTQFGTFEDDTWVPLLLNQGFKHKYIDADGDLKGPKIHLDESGNPDTVNLALDGTILPVNAAYEYLYFRTKQYSEFAALNLGPYN